MTIESNIYIRFREVSGLRIIVGYNIRNLYFR